jgi:hypothetical protein
MKLTESKLKKIIEQVMNESQELMTVIEFLDALEPHLGAALKKPAELMFTGNAGQSKGFSDYTFEDAIQSVNKELGGDTLWEGKNWGYLVLLVEHRTADLIKLPRSKSGLSTGGWGNTKLLGAADLITVQTVVSRDADLHFIIYLEAAGSIGMPSHELVRISSTADSDVIPTIMNFLNASADELAEFAESHISTHERKTVSSWDEI